MLRVIVSVVRETKFINVIFCRSQLHRLGHSVSSTSTVVVAVIISILKYKNKLNVTVPFDNHLYNHNKLTSTAGTKTKFDGTS